MRVFDLKLVSLYSFDKRLSPPCTLADIDLVVIMQESIYLVTFLQLLPPLLLGAFCEYFLECLLWNGEVELVQNAIPIEDVADRKEDLLIEKS